GTVLWFKTYGGTEDEDELDINVIETLDLGFIITGRTHSVSAGVYRGYAIKTDLNGLVEWEKTYSSGSTSGDLFRGVIQCSDSSYVICGTLNSAGFGSSDAFLLKLDPNGNMLWQ